MGEYRKMIVPDWAMDELSTAVANSKAVHIVSVGTSDRNYSDDDIKSMSFIPGLKQTAQPVHLSKDYGGVIVESMLENSELTEGYHIRSMFVIAEVKGQEFVLGGCGSDVPSWMPSFNGVTSNGISVKCNLLLDSIMNGPISLEVNPAGTASIRDIERLQKQIDDVKGYIGYSDDVYGIEVDFVNDTYTRLGAAVNKLPGWEFDSVRAFGGRRRCNLTNDGVVTAYVGDDGYTETGKLTKSVSVNGRTFPSGTPVQVMVEQPRFYYQVVPLTLQKIDGGYAYDKVRYYVSDHPHDGFKLHPAFAENGKENEKIYLAAYEASGFDVSANSYVTNNGRLDIGNDMLSSVANVNPASGFSRSNFRQLANKRGGGWNLNYAATVSASQILMLIEFGNFKMNSAIGGGNCDSDSAIATGSTMTLKNRTGAVGNGVTYRGEENLWCNVSNYVDGLNQLYSANKFQIYVADHDFADSTESAPYENTGLAPCPESQYTSAFGYVEKYDWLFMPASSDRDGVNNTDWGYISQDTSPWNGALVGADFGYTFSVASPWLVVFDTSPHVRFGTRLVYIPSKK